MLTLPASFDDVERELTIRAAKDAGLEPTLLEEPTAAFYDAMRDVEAIREHVVPRSPEEEKTVLVCDVGGGTTDLSLMAIAYAPKDKGGFTVRRVAVGRHILLGGDNMDLALAHLAEGRITGGGARLARGCRCIRRTRRSPHLRCTPCDRCTPSDRCTPCDRCTRRRCAAP